MTPAVDLELRLTAAQRKPLCVGCTADDMPDSALGAAESPTAASQGDFGSQQTDSTEEPQLASLTVACPSMPSITSVPAAAPYASATVPCRVRAATSHKATFVLKSNSFCVSDNQHVAV